MEDGQRLPRTSDLPSFQRVYDKQACRISLSPKTIVVFSSLTAIIRDKNRLSTLSATLHS